MEQTNKQGRRFKYSKPDGSIDIEKIQSLIDQYFNDNDKYSVPRFCLALDITKETMRRWKDGITDDHKEDDEVIIYTDLRDTIKKGLLRLEAWLLENDGKNTIKDLAALNHSFEYRDTKQIEGSIDVNIKMGKYDKYAQ